jgi:Phytanoyl-CoA dioxygenase (PhyH)
MLTSEQRSDFRERGHLRLRGAFSRAEAAAMEEFIWATLSEKHGVLRDDPHSWEIPLSSGLQPIRSHPVFRPIGGPVLRAALDELIGEGRWREPGHWGQFLVSFPVTPGAPYQSKPMWHTDFPYTLPGDRVIGALVFSFIGEVPERTGGTLAVSGSHKVVRRFMDANPQLRKVKMKVARRALMSSEPWLSALCTESDDEDWAERCTDSQHAIDKILLRVVELTGEPGDLVVAHPWLLHSPSPNKGDRPRFMRVQRIGPVR